MKDEIAEQAASEDYRDIHQMVFTIASRIKFGQSYTEYFTTLDKLIVEACRQRALEELDRLDKLAGTFCIEGDYCKMVSHDDVLFRLSALSEPKKEDSLTPKETKD